MNTRKKILIITILCMVVGFASVATTLYITGQANIGNNVEDFDIYFSDAIIDGTQDLSVITENRKRITFNTRRLTDVGDKAILEYEVTNNSLNYNAEVAIECVDPDSNRTFTPGVDTTDYYTFDTTDTPDIIEAKRKDTGSIVVTLTNVTTENRTFNFTCTMTANATERTSLGEEIVLNTDLSLTNYIKSIASNNDDLMYDGTNDNNLRYVGKTPNNYVDFNGELWRIVGVFGNNVKIIRNDSIGLYSWDSSELGVNSGYGINEWSQSDLMQELNGDYLNISLNNNPFWYDGPNNAKATSFNKDLVLSSDAQNMIVDATWYTAAMNAHKIGYSEQYSSEAYISEHSNFTGKICSSGSNCTDDVDRTTAWTGKVGLISTSDYGFAGGNYTTNVELGQLNMYVQYNWLYDGKNEWTINSFAYDYYSNYISFVTNNGYVSRNPACANYSVRPVVYLNSNIIYDGGEGTAELPIKLKDNGISETGDIESNSTINLVSYLQNSLSSNSDLFTDDYGNIRYKGLIPNNYIMFNNELWQIIGIIDGNVKIIRKKSLGEYVWDTNDLGYGVNEWSLSDIKTELNGDYLDLSLSNNQLWYDGYNNSKNGIFDISNRLSNQAQSIIVSKNWYTGAISNVSSTASELYNQEHSDQIGKICDSSLNGCNDDIERKTVWNGYVGLASPSDFKYSIGEICMHGNNCQNYGWLTDYKDEWYINPATDSSSAYYVSKFSAASSSYSFGSISNTSSYTKLSVRPVVYLNSNVVVKNNDIMGTMNKPFVIVY